MVPLISALVKTIEKTQVDVSWDVIDTSWYDNGMFSRSPFRYISQWFVVALDKTMSRSWLRHDQIHQIH